MAKFSKLSVFLSRTIPRCVPCQDLYHGGYPGVVGFDCFVSDCNRKKPGELVRCGQYWPGVVNTGPVWSVLVLLGNTGPGGEILVLLGNTAFPGKNTAFPGKILHFPAKTDHFLLKQTISG